MKGRLAALAVAGVFIVAACGDDAEPTPDPAVAFCDSAASLAAAVVNFRQMDGRDTIEDIQTSGEAVRAAVQALETSAQNLADSQVQDIQDAAAELQSAVEAIPDTDTVDQALASLAPQVAALRAAVNAAGETNCARVLVREEASIAAEEAQAAEASMEAEASAAASEAEATMEAAASEVEATMEAAGSEAEATMEAAADEAQAAMESMLPDASPEG